MHFDSPGGFLVFNELNEHTALIPLFVNTTFAVNFDCNCDQVGADNMERERKVAIASWEKDQET